MRASSVLFGLVAVAQAQSLTKTPITSSIWNTMIRYTHFQAASAIDNCVTPPYGSTVVARITNVLGRKLSIFRDDTAKELIVSVPGTNFSNPFDEFTAVDIAAVPFFLDGVDCSGCKVAQGPLNAWISLENNVKGNLTAQLAKHPDYQVVITGHSLGASIAAIAYVDLLQLGYKVKQVYTFGQARTGNPAFAAKIDQLSGNSNTTIGRYWRITHARDPVPGLVPEGTDNQHEMIEFWQQNGSQPNVTSQALTSRCYGDEPADCINMFPGGPANIPANTQYIPDHLTYTNIYLPPNSVSCNGVH